MAQFVTRSLYVIRLLICCCGWDGSPGSGEDVWSSPSKARNGDASCLLVPTSICRFRITFVRTTANQKPHGSTLTARSTCTAINNRDTTPKSVFVHRNVNPPGSPIIHSGPPPTLIGRYARSEAVTQSGSWASRCDYYWTQTLSHSRQITCLPCIFAPHSLPNPLHQPKGHNKHTAVRSKSV